MGQSFDDISKRNRQQGDARTLPPSTTVFRITECVGELSGLIRDFSPNLMPLNGYENKYEVTTSESVEKVETINSRADSHLN